MGQIKYLIDGQDLGSPRNWEELEFTIDYLNKQESLAINADDLEFVDDANEYLQQRVLNGMTGGVGIFEGIPCEIILESDSASDMIFEGYLDATDGTVVFGGEEIVLKMKKLAGNDWLNDVADSFSFAYLYEEGVITDSDFVKIPYVINYIPDGTQLIIVSISVFLMTKELIESIQKLSESISEVIDAATPVIGVSVGLGAGVVTAWDLGGFISVALKALARLIYVIAMVIAIKNLIESLFDQILQKKRNHLGMTFETMMKKGCQYLGLGFQSELLSVDYKNWVHIPRKDKKGDTSGTKGFPTNTEPIYTFGGLIRTLMEKYNADYRIRNNVFYFERRDKFRLPTQFQIPDYFVNEERLLDPFEFNTDEIIANYNINWALDVQDQNTLDIVDGRVFQAITSPIAINNQKLVNIKGLKEVAIPFSMGLEKRELTDIEKALKALGKIVDNITGIFGGGTNFASQVESRIGSLLLSSHFLTNGKVVVMSGNKLANNQRKELDAKKLWDNCHFINSFALYQGTHNQFKRIKNHRVPIDVSDLALLMVSNQGTDSEGRDFEIEKVVFTPELGTAVIDYRIKMMYSKNLQITFL